MRPLTNIPLILTVAALLLLTAACGPTARQQALLNRADSLMNVNPAAALRLTDSLLADGQGGSHWQSQLRLRRLNAINKLDTVFTAAHVVQAKTLADHFDRQGTPNERMLAHYLLGRTYADTGEAPMALQCYQEATEAADTTNSSCDYHTLCRVYSQKADIFFRQNLMRDYLNSLELSVAYAWRAKDTITAFREYAYKIMGYNQLQQEDSVILVFDNAFDSIYAHLGIKHASQFCMFPVSVLLSKNNLHKARQCMDIYEQYSGYFDSLHNIASGREVYFYYRGLYHLYSNHYDSAEYYFRKELDCGKDFYNQNAAALGLANLYQQIHRMDSSAKYALYSYAMLDSFYRHKSTDAVVQVQAMHNYSRHLQIAQQERKRADRERHHFWLLVVIGTIIIVVSTFVFFILEQKKKNAISRFREKESELRKSQAELLLLQEKEADSSQLIIEKLTEIQRLKSEIDKLREKGKLIIDIEKTKMKETGVYEILKKKDAKGIKLEEEDWTLIDNYLKSYLPDFYKFINEIEDEYGQTKTRICKLLRLHVGVNSTGSMVGTSGSYISKICSELLTKLYGINGTSKDLIKELLKMN